MNSKKVGLLLFSTLLALLTCEAAVRLIGVAPSVKRIELTSDDTVYKRSDNAVLGFELKANYKNDSPNYIESYESTNSHGQRDRQRSLAKPPGKQRVLLLGDSVVEGYGLKASETISAQLEGMYGDDSVEVLNFGVSAYCTLAEVELLATKGVDFEPDIVVLVFVENDFDNFNREAFPLEPIQRLALVEFAFETSHLCRLALLQFDIFQFRSAADPVAWNKTAIGDNNVVEGLERFRELAGEHGFRPLVAIWPRFLDGEIIDPLPIPDNEQLIVEAIAGNNGLPSIRLSTQFRKELANTTKRSGRISPKRLYSQGDELHPSPEGARVAAVALYNALEELNSDPSIIESQNVDLTEALATLPKNDPSYARVHNHVGNHYLKEGKVNDAIRAFETSLAEDSKDPATYNNLGIALERVGDRRNDAIEQYQKAIALRPDFAEAHFNLGRLLQNDDVETAQSHLIEAVKAKPDFVPAHYRLSQLLLSSERHQAAEAGFRQVLRLAPDHAGAIQALAGILARERRFPDAKVLYEQLVKIQPKNAEALNNLGVITSTLGDAKAATEYFRRAVAADPNHPRAAQNLQKLQSPTTP